MFIIRVKIFFFHKIRINNSKLITLLYVLWLKSNFDCNLVYFFQFIDPLKRTYFNFHVGRQHFGPTIVNHFHSLVNGWVWHYRLRLIQNHILWIAARVSRDFPCGKECQRNIFLPYSLLIPRNWILFLLLLFFFSII